MSDERELLIEAAVAAWRPQNLDGGLRAHPAWEDLDASARAEVHEASVRARALEAAADAQGLSTTARAVLARIRGTR